MSRYQDKSLEEVRPIVEQYVERFKERTGRSPNSSELSRKLIELAEKREEAMFYSTFESLTSASLRLAAQCATEGEIPAQDHVENWLKEWPEVEDKADETNTANKCNSNSDNMGKKRGRPRKSV